MHDWQGFMIKATWKKLQKCIVQKKKNKSCCPDNTYLDKLDQLTPIGNILLFSVIEISFQLSFSPILSRLQICENESNRFPGCLCFF